MGFGRWLERKIFLGEVMKDYGILDDSRVGVVSLRTSVLLCRRRGRLKLVFRTVGKSPLSINVNFTYVEATSATLSKLGEVVRDALVEVNATGSAAFGPSIRE